MWVHTLFLILFFTILLLATGLVWCLLCVLLFLYCMRIPVQSDSDSKAVAWLRFTYSSGALRLQLESEMSGAIPETRVAHINCGENGGETEQQQLISGSTCGISLLENTHDGPSFGAALPPSVSVRFQLSAELQVDQTQVPAPPWSLSGSDQKDGELNFFFFYNLYYY